MNLLDADAVSKFAHWDLLGELAALTGVPTAQTATLSSLVHRAARSCGKPDGRLFKDAIAAERALKYLQQLAPLPQPDEDLITRLQHVPAIDPGDAVLLAILRAHANTVLITGDKRAVKALATALPESILHSLSDRIVTLEQIVLAFLKRNGIDWLRAHICPYHTLDKAIGVIMGGDCTAPAEAAEAGLGSYIADLRSLSGTLLRATAPFWRE
jgi:hypothetical protein